MNVVILVLISFAIIDVVNFVVFILKGTGIQLILITDEESYPTVNSILYYNIGKIIVTKLTHNQYLFSASKQRQMLIFYE